MPLKCEAVIKQMKDKVAAADPSSPNRQLPAVFQYNITVGGKQVQQWTMDLKDLKVYEGPAKGVADVTMTVDDEVMLKLSTNEMTQEEATKNGTLKVEGDVEIMKKFTLLLKKMKENE